MGKGQRKSKDSGRIHSLDLLRACGCGGREWNASDGKKGGAKKNTVRKAPLVGEEDGNVTKGAKKEHARTEKRI